MTLPVPTMEQCQEKLIAHGFPLPKYGADGRGGRETQSAILAYQKSVGLPQSGQFDKLTVSALWAQPQFMRTLESPIGKAALAILEYQLRRSLLFEALQGKKTYIVLVVGAIVIVVNHFFGPIPNVNLDPNQWLAQLGALIPFATIRAAITKGPKP